MKICKVEGCNNKHYGKGYCGKHYQQMKKKGKIYKTYKEPNDIVLYDDYAEIIILDNKSNEVGRVKIDLDDVDRVCTQHQNCMNQNKRSNNTSGYTGVLWDKAKNKWMARIKVNYKQIFLGYYDTLEEAIKVREQAEIRYFGEYRNK